MKILLSTLLIATSLLLSSPIVLAHSSKDSCDVDIQGGVEINQQAIKFFKKDQQNNIALYKIVDDNLLFINGTKIALSNDQQVTVHNYSTSIRAIIPKIKNLALDGVNIAVDGVTMAFDGLLGKDNTISPDLVKELGQVRQHILTQFDQNKPIYFGDKSISGENFFKDSFDDRFDSLIEKSVEKSMGSLLIALGKEMIFNRDNKNNFEERIDKFSNNMEKQMKLKTAKLKQRADGLCQSMIKIDTLEEQLKNKVPKLASTNILTVNYTLHGKNRS